MHPRDAQDKREGAQDYSRGVAERPQDAPASSREHLKRSQDVPERSQDISKTLQDVFKTLSAAGASVREVDLPDPFPRMFDAHTVIGAVEALPRADRHHEGDRSLLRCTAAAATATAAAAASGRRLLY